MPVPAYNDFNKLFDSFNSVGIDSVVPFKVEEYTASDFLSKSWPVQPGNYRVVIPTNSVAVVLLSDVSVDELSNLDLSAAAIVGTITTENLGVEHLVKNIIANPCIRHLILYGNEIQGHQPGDALLRLHEIGTNSSGHILSAKGARPVLKNLTRLEIDHFRSQVKITDLIGKTDLSLLERRLGEFDEQTALQPYESGLRIDLIEVRKAQPARRLKLDKVGYFVIMVMPKREPPILVEHYTNDGVLCNMIEGGDAASVCATIVEMKLVSQLDHAAYLGRELARAELSLVAKKSYIQDKAQGQLAPSQNCL